MKENCQNITKGIYNKANIIFSGKFLKASPWKLGRRQACPPQIFLFTIVLEFLIGTIKARKKVRIRNFKKRKFYYLQRLLLSTQEIQKVSTSILVYLKSTHIKFSRYVNLENQFIFAY